MYYKLYFDQTGLQGMDTPPADDPVVIAQNFAFLRRIAFATQDYHERIVEIESAYQDAGEQGNKE